MSLLYDDQRLVLEDARAALHELSRPPTKAELYDLTAAFGQLRRLATHTEDAEARSLSDEVWGALQPILPVAARAVRMADTEALARDLEDTLRAADWGEVLNRCWAADGYVCAATVVGETALAEEHAETCAELLRVAPVSEELAEAGGRVIERHGVAASAFTSQLWGTLREGAAAIERVEPVAELPAALRARLAEVAAESANVLYPSFGARRETQSVSGEDPLAVAASDLALPEAKVELLEEGPEGVWQLMLEVTTTGAELALYASDPTSAPSFGVSHSGTALGLSDDGDGRVAAVVPHDAEVLLLTIGEREITCHLPQA